MYPHEITTTPFWIRHELPLGPPSPPNGDEELRQQIRSRNVISTDEMIEEYVRHERARSDLKWYLDQFFTWPLPNPFVGQLIVASMSGFVHLTYIIDRTPVAVSITPVDKFGDFIMIEYDDIYDATDSYFMENYLVNHYLLHTQQVLDYIAKQDRKHALLQSSHHDPFVSSTVNTVTTGSRARKISHTDTTPQPQPSLFIINQSMAVIPTLTESRHDQSRTNASNVEIELSVEVETDHCESIQKFAADPLYGEISPRIIEVACQEPKHPIPFRLYQHGSDSKVACHPAHRGSPVHIFSNSCK